MRGLLDLHTSTTEKKDGHWIRVSRGKTGFENSLPTLKINYCAFRLARPRAVLTFAKQANLSFLNNTYCVCYTLPTTDRRSLRNPEIPR